MYKKLKKILGFTLAELLVVVAIIAVLVAVSIPIFTSQLEKSRNATDIYNAKVIADTIQIYYMTNPEELTKLQQECDKTGSLHCLQIIVSEDKMNIPPILVEPLKSAGLVTKMTGNNSSDMSCKSKTSWVSYSIAVTTYKNVSSDGSPVIGYCGRKKGDLSAHSWGFYYTNPDETPFRSMLLG